MATYTAIVHKDFFESFVSLPPAVQKKAYRVALAMLDNPWGPRGQTEKVRCADDGVHSSRVDDNYRLIWKHVKPDKIVLCVVGKHDEAYRLAQRRMFKLEGNVVRWAPIEEVAAIPPDQNSLFGWRAQQGPGLGALFRQYDDAGLLGMGVPEYLLPQVRSLNDLNDLDRLEAFLPREVWLRLVDIALSEVERPVVPDKDLAESLEKYEGGDELRMFVDSEEFKRALAGDLEEWMLFLAPQQRDLVNRDFSGPARIKGVSGSGKTVVAIHRARQLAKRIGGTKTVLFVTFGKRLPQVNAHLLKRLAGEGAPELQAIECVTIHSWCARFLRDNGRAPNVNEDAAREALREAIAEVSQQNPKLGTLWRRSEDFFASEIKYMIKGRALNTLDEYLALERSGRGTALSESERRAVWRVYETYQAKLDERRVWDWDDLIVQSLRLAQEGALAQPYKAAVVDEIQDLSEAAMRLLRTIVAPGPNDLFLVGDGLQRLFPGGYVLSRIGIDIVGRSTVLRRNYRNTQEILRAAFAVMEGVRFNDMDDQESEVPEPEYSPRHGPVPELRMFPTLEAELDWVASEIGRIVARGEYKPGDFAVLYRRRRRPDYQDLVQKHLGRHFDLVELSNEAESYFSPSVKHSTFDGAKGLEFKVVFVVGVTDGIVVPRDDWTLEGPALEEYMALERSRLFVAMTRARDRLYLSCARGQPSRFLARVPAKYLARVPVKAPDKAAAPF